MAQFLRPTSDVTNTGTGGFGSIDESSASDADFWWGADNTVEELEVALTDVSDPTSSATHQFRYRIAKTNDGALDGGGNSCTVTARLMQGGTQIAADSAKTATGTWTTYTYTLSTGEADSITNYNDLRLEFVTSASGGNPTNRRGAGVSWAELEIPDADTSTTLTPGPVVFDFNPVAPVVVSDNPYWDVVESYLPVFYAPFDETTGTTADDRAGSPHDGTYQATPTLGQIGGDPPGLSVALDGTEWISVPDGATFDFTSPFSIMLWVKQTTVNFLDNALWGKGTGGVPYIFVTGSGQSPAGRVTLAKSDTADNVQTSAVLTDTDWHQIIVVYSHSTIGKIYFDGVDSGGTPSYNAFSTNAIAVGIGSKTGASADSGWKGNLKHVALFDYALDATEVADLYDSAFPSAGTTFTPDPVVFDVSLVAPALATSLALAPSAVAFDLNPVAPTLGLTLALAPSAVAIDVNPVAPAVALGALELTPAVVVIDVNPVAPALGLTLALTPAAVAFDVNPVAPSVDFALVVAPDPVVFDLNPVAPSIVLGDLTLTPASVSIPLALPAVVVDIGGILTLAPDPVVFDLNPVAPALGLALALTPSAVAFDVNPVAPALAHVLALAPAAVSIPLALPAAVVDVESGATTLAPNPVSFALGPVAPALGLTLGLAPSAVAIDLNPVAPTLGLVLSLTPSPVQIVSSVPAPTLVSTLLLAPDPVAVSVALPNSILRFDWVLSPDPVLIVVSPVAPVVTVDLRIAADALNMLKKNRSRWPWDRGGFPRR